MRGTDILKTIRYTELRAFESVAKKCAKDGAQMTSPETFTALVDEMVDLSADLLEGVATEMDAMSQRVFSRLGRQRLRRPLPTMNSARR